LVWFGFYELFRLNAYLFCKPFSFDFIHFLLVLMTFFIMMLALFQTFVDFIDFSVFRMIFHFGTTSFVNRLLTSLFSLLMDRFVLQLASFLNRFLN
jgi:hypothetical protein